MSGMSFNGTTSILSDASAKTLSASAFTLLAWVNAAGQGEGSFGRVIQADETGGGTSLQGFLLAHNNANNQMYFTQIFNGATPQGEWRFAATDNQWNAVAVFYDRGSSANVPTARVNFASATVTTITTPSGSSVAPNAGYAIGNRSAADRTWNGALMHVQYHPATLSSGDADKALKYPGSIYTNGALWWPMLNGTYTEMWSANGTTWSRDTDPTATAISSYTTSSPSAVTLWQRARPIFA
jgi:hypothetical protein